MSDYQRIRALFPDHLGLARGKYLPAHLAHKGTRHCLSVFALNFDRTMVPAPGAKMLEGLPDCDLVLAMNEVRPSWEAATGVVIGDLFFRGAPLAIAPRHVLRKAVDDWKALGYTVKVGIELEAFVMQPDGRGGWTEWDTPTAYVYGTGPAVDPVGLLDDVMRTAAACRLPIESINSEYDTPQFELTLVYARGDRGRRRRLPVQADGARAGGPARPAAHLHRQAVRRPRRQRLPRESVAARRPGRERLHDPSAGDGLSTLARQCIAGMLAHFESTAGICAPTVNAYKRLKPAQLAGYWANWGYDHRGVSVRVPGERGAGTRLEHRMSDGAANPYLATAAVLQAARLGVVHQLVPPAPEEQDCLTSQSTTRHVPENLSLALDALEADTALVEAIGPEVVAQFAAVKRAEWSRFAAAVTDWELKTYLPFL